MTSFLSPSFLPSRSRAPLAARAPAIALAGIALLAIAGEVVRAADEQVTVELADGRRVSGQMDPASDERFLWLVGREAGIELRSRYDRRDVVAISPQAGESREASDLSASSGFSSPAGCKQPGCESPDPELSAAFAPVQSVQIYAEVANWDGDVPIDGFLVTIEPRDALGRLTPVRGSVDLSLLGEVWPRGVQPDVGLRPGFQELERTSHLLDERDFADGPAVVRLPLRHVHPDFDVQIATYGIVHARLGVPGQGVFEASDSFVRLRPASPPRDRLQLFSGQRFFPSEHVTGRR